MYKNTKGKVISARCATEIAGKLRQAGKKVVVTNGSFDILHAGHVEYLERSRRLGDVLFVALNSDSSLRRNKGRQRPIIPQRQRALLLAALACVDHVVIFSGDKPDGFLLKLAPDYYTKGGSFLRGRLAETERLLAAVRCKTVVFPLRKGLSTSEIIKKCAGE